MSRTQEHAVETVRNVAVDHHHDMSQAFEQYYRDMAASRFSTAFTYGRYKVDEALDAELRALPKGSDVLDVGCGTGNYLVRFRELGHKAVGVEPAQGMIDAAKRLDSTLVVKQGVATALPYPDNSFDFVTAIEVLRYLHLDDVRASFKEMLRVLRPGGKLFVTMVNKYALDGFYVFNWARQQLRRSQFDRKNPHCEFFTPAELIREMERAGGVDARTEGKLFAPVRFAYKIHQPAAEALLRAVEPYEEAISSAKVFQPFAGHLIGIAQKPKR